MRQYLKAFFIMALIAGPALFSFPGTSSAQAAGACQSGYALVPGPYATGISQICKSDNGTSLMQYLSDGSVNTCTASGGCLTTGSWTPQETQTTIAASAATAPDIKECQNWGISNQFKCAGISVIILLASAIVDITTNILNLADYLFNLAIQTTILDFGTLYNNIRDAAGQIWTVFRDLANILIIGLFVFIAISIILGLQEYGQKKLIARVIIIATLINFSFLFTLIAINTSNALATSIYNSALAPIVQDQGSTGVAGAFEKMLKTTTARETSAALTNLWNAPNGGLGVVLMHTFVSALFQLAAAAVFLYGTLLLAARFIALIILLVISSAAFASYLSPSMAEGGYGWSAWWHQLLRNSFFAPVLMIFLFASLQIAVGITSGQSGSLGNLATVGGVADPTTVAVVLSYIIVLGFLLFGIIIANNIAGGAASRLALGSLSLGTGITGRLIGAPGRWIVGGRAAASAHALDEGMRAKAKKMATLDLKNPEQAKEYKKLRSEWASMNRQKGRREYLAKSSFDINDTKLAQKLHGAVGGPFASKSGASYEKTAHTQDDKTLKEAIKAAVDNNAAKDVARGENKSQLEAAQKAHEDSQKLLEATRENADSIKNSEKLLTRLEEHRGTLADATAKQADSAKKLDTGKITQAEHDSNMAAQKARIDTARNSIGAIQRRINEIDAPIREVQKQHSETSGALKELNKKIDNRTKVIQDNSSQIAADMARMTAGGAVTRFVRRAISVDLDSTQSHHVADAARKRTRGDRMQRASRTKEKTEDTPKDTSHSAPASGGGAAASGH